MRTIVRSSGAPAALLLTFAFLALQALSFWLVTVGYGLRLAFLAGGTVFVVVHLGSAVPGAPANVGTFQLFTVIGLVLFGVDRTTAAGFSLVAFALLTAPLWALGLLALGRSGISLAALRDMTARRPPVRSVGAESP
jgi:hypothetical protein